MIFQYVFKDPNPFIKTIELVKDVIEIMNFQFHRGGIQFQSMDNAHVSLSTAKFSKECFSKMEHYRFMQRGIHLKSLFLYLKCVKNDDELSFSSFKEDEILISVKKKNNEIYTFQLNGVLMEEQSLDIPEDVKYDCQFTMNANDFSEIIKNMASFGGDVIFSNKQKLLDVSCKDIHGSLQFSKVFPKENMCTLRNVSSSFSNRYLQMFSKGNNISSKVKVSFSDEEPMCLDYSFFKDSSVKFYLAPKFGEDD